MVTVLIPAYNEETSIGTVIHDLHQHGYNDILVVDDGSHDATYYVAKNAGAKVIKHPVNLGLGGALCTGLQYAKDNHCEYVITFDADGQHDVNDILRVITPLFKDEADAVIGSRMRLDMPLIRRIGNTGLNIITFSLFNVYSTDTQSGLRAFNYYAISRIHLTTNRMEVSSEFIKEIGYKKLRYQEVPIKTIYTDYSKARGQSSLNAFNIVFKLMLKKLMR